ncbi:MAG: heparinase II/III-family protein, partial [Cyanobium sp.]
AARRMQDRALLLLRRELAVQLLPDGGHEERSAAYHLLLLDRLVELGCCLAAIDGDRPVWLLQAIAAMGSWARAVRLESGLAPRFNDSAADAAPPLDAVVAFAEGFLQCRPGPPGRGLRQALLVAGNRHAAPALAACAPEPPGITDLPATGWTLLRPGHGWELAFRCGTPCPSHLPSHVHSDQLSLELSHRGRWLLGEAGTSVYGLCPERAYERSGAAHNVLQLGVAAPDGAIRWIEPVQVWGAFRAGRKARPRQRRCGWLPRGGCYAEGGHDGFDHRGARHHRRVELTAVAPQRLSLRLRDTVTTTSPLVFRIWWHLAPGCPQELLEALRLEAPTAGPVSAAWHTTWFAQGFGRRSPRQSYCLSGSLAAGVHELLTVLPLSLPPPAAPLACPASG